MVSYLVIYDEIGPKCSIEKKKKRNNPTKENKIEASDLIQRKASFVVGISQCGPNLGASTDN